MSKKKRRPARGLKAASNEDLAEEIVKIWDAACKSGLGDKHLASDVKTKFKPRFIKKLVARLDDNEIFTAGDKRQTQLVARDVGKVCAVMTRGDTVSRDTFEEVFRMLRRHAACPADRKNVTRAGAGVWCDVQIN